MNKINIDFMEKNLKKYDIKPRNVLDIGSLDVNGSARDLFDCPYTGIDIVGGENVDMVIDGKDIGGSYSLTICLNTLEHAKEFHLVVDNIREITEDYFFLSVPGIRFPVHHKPDYWRFTEQAVREIIMEGFEVLEFEEVPTKPNANYLINCLGRKL